MFTILIIPSPYKESAVTSAVLQMKKMSIKEVEYLATGRTANKWQRWASPQALLTLEPMYVIYYFIHSFIQQEVLSTT